MKPRFKHALIAMHFNVLAIVGFAYLLPVEAANLESDLAVSFGGEGHSLVVGNVKNKSANSYPCVRLKFFLLEGNHKSGYFSTDVRSIQPHSVVPYKEKMPYPAGYGLESISVCGEGSPVDAGGSNVPKTPLIVSFRASPTSVEAGKDVTFFWEVKDAKTVRFYEDHEELEGRIQLPNGTFGWPLTMPGAFSSMQLKTATYKLVAENRESKTTTKTFTVRVKASQLQGTYTIQQKSNLRYMDAHEGSNDNSVVTRDRQNNNTQR